MKNPQDIQSWHAHIYFAADTVDQARALALAADAAFDLQMGRVHERAVGPHPMWSCQLACTPAVFADLLPWLTLNRNGLIIFAHPESGDELADHRDHAVWLVGFVPLNLGIFEGA